MELYKEKRPLGKIRFTVTLSVIALFLIGFVSAFSDETNYATNEEIYATVKKDSIKSVEAFKKSLRGITESPLRELPSQW